MNSPKIEEIGKGAGGVSSNATTKSGGLAPTLNPSDRLPPSMVPRRIRIDMEGHTLQQDQLVRSIPDHPQITASCRGITANGT